MNRSLTCWLWSCWLTLVAATAQSADSADTHPDLHLIPWPKTVATRAGHMPLTAASRIVADDPRLLPLARVLAAELKVLTALDLPCVTTQPRAGDIVLRIDTQLRADEPILSVRERNVVRTTDGAHTIDIDQQALVSGFDYRAVAEGSSTLLQLLGRSRDGYRLPRIAIKDWPHADYCGVMLDVARQDHSLDDIKKVVQLCRLYKARYLQLHLTDDQGWTFPSTKYPELGTKNYGAHGGIAPRRYDLAGLKELVTYADARGVTLVPEFEVPGHSGAAVRAMPQVFDALDPDSQHPIGIGCLNLSNEAMYPVLETLIGEMCDVFRSSPYFHIGSDEVTTGRLSLNPSYAAFMQKHGLKDDHELANHFVREVCAMVARHGKKAVKWEGLANYATNDVIIMCWDNNSTLATEAQQRGYTTITCPWNLGVPWEQWNMYRCNGSQLRRGDSVLGATLVAWEQPPLTHITNLRNLASRQERTWGPDNQVTEAGFAARFQPLDAVAGMLIDMPPQLLADAQFSTTVGIRDFLDPRFALDRSDATFYASAAIPQIGDHFTVIFAQPLSLHAVEVLTGSNGRGRLDGGDLLVSADGQSFEPVARIEGGAAHAVLKQNRVAAIRLRAVNDETAPLAVRAIKLQRLVELSGPVPNPAAKVGDGNVAALSGDTQFVRPIGTCATPVINRGHRLTVNSEGQAANLSGSLSGTGQVDLAGGVLDAPLILDGTLPNALAGTWHISGHVRLNKAPGTSALGSSIVVGGAQSEAVLAWDADEQIDDRAQLEATASRLSLNGRRERLARLTLQRDARIDTGSARTGVLTVDELIVDGTRLPAGIYTSSEPWLLGHGYVVVDRFEFVEIQGVVKDPGQALASDQVAVLAGPTTLELGPGETATPIVGGPHPLALIAGGEAVWSGFITGSGPLRITAAADRKPLTIAGRATNSYQGDTLLDHGVLRLAKPHGAVAIPGNLMLGGVTAENLNDGVVWSADGQVAAQATLTLQGTQPSFLDLDGHHARVSRVNLSPVAQIRTGDRGTLTVQQLFVDGQRVKDGEYSAPQTWLTGSGKVSVDSRVDIQGIVGAPEVQIGTGNLANLTGDTKFAYPASGCPVDVATNGHTLVFDSGNGNAFTVTGSISGTGNIEFHMGPSYTDFKDAPLPIAGDRPNTASGKFLVRKGRVQLQKPPGVDAISGDVIVGGQGFNDCLFWMASDQLKDNVNITLIDAGSNGAAYLDLNGHSESAASLTLTTKNKVKTTSPAGAAGQLRVHKLTLDGVPLPPGRYTSATAKWILGSGSVEVAGRVKEEE